MKFFIDTANLNEIKEAQNLGILDGVTTNPSLMAKEGITGKANIIQHYKYICDIVSGDELIAYCENKISEKATVPKHIEIITEMPLTAVGKIFKPELRKRSITRIYDKALATAGVSATVLKVEEDPKEGLKAHIKGVSSDKDIGKVLDPFTFGWQSDEG